MIAEGGPYGSVRWNQIRVYSSFCERFKNIPAVFTYLRSFVPNGYLFTFISFFPEILKISKSNSSYSHQPSLKVQVD